VDKQEKLVLVTPGGGGDGYQLVNTYLSALEEISQHESVNSLIIFGSEMPQSEREDLAQKVQQYSHVIALDFTDNLMGYINASDLVVSMAGYNTITEILSLRKKAVVVPRQHPSREQLIRSERMSNQGLFQMISSEQLTVSSLSEAVQTELKNNHSNSFSPFTLDFNGLLKIEDEIGQLLYECRSPWNYLTA
ncbi:MAG: glycosyltransferase, partial [Cyanobacteriota bacterium]|nr:glycosyltransferase [Cyanobacteriota bacterium]